MTVTDQTAEPDVKQSPYDMIGGQAAVRRIVDRFYDIMDSDPAAAGIRAMHANDLAPMRDRLFEFLSGWLGGRRSISSAPTTSASSARTGRSPSAKRSATNG